MLVIATGGTVEFTYDEVNGGTTFPETSHAQEIAEAAGVNIGFFLNQLFMVDSEFMTDAQRLLIVETVLESPDQETVILHGTDTMNETAFAIDRALRARRERDRKAVVLTGAMRPFDFGRSEIVEDFRVAINGVRTARTGVYIAMHGHFLPHDEIRKNRAIGRFVPIAGDENAAM